MLFDIPQYHYKYHIDQLFKVILYKMEYNSNINILLYGIHYLYIIYLLKIFNFLFFF